MIKNFVVTMMKHTTTEIIVATDMEEIIITTLVDFKNIFYAILHLVVYRYEILIKKSKNLILCQQNKKQQLINISTINYSKHDYN